MRVVYTILAVSGWVWLGVILAALLVRAGWRRWQGRGQRQRDLEGMSRHEEQS